jgi:hypothetical protein
MSVNQQRVDVERDGEDKRRLIFPVLEPLLWEVASSTTNSIGFHLSLRIKAIVWSLKWFVFVLLTTERTRISWSCQHRILSYFQGPVSRFDLCSFQ